MPTDPLTNYILDLLEKDQSFVGEAAHLINPSKEQTAQKIAGIIRQAQADGIEQGRQEGMIIAKASDGPDNS